MPRSPIHPFQEFHAISPSSPTLRQRGAMPGGPHSKTLAARLRAHVRQCAGDKRCCTKPLVICDLTDRNAAMCLNHVIMHPTCGNGSGRFVRNDRRTRSSDSDPMSKAIHRRSQNPVKLNGPADTESPSGSKAFLAPPGISSNSTTWSHNAVEDQTVSRVELGKAKRGWPRVGRPHVGEGATPLFWQQNSSRFPPLFGVADQHKLMPGCP